MPKRLVTWRYYSVIVLARSPDMELTVWWSAAARTTDRKALPSAVLGPVTRKARLARREAGPLEFMEDDLCLRNYVSSQAKRSAGGPPLGKVGSEQAAVGYGSAAAPAERNARCTGISSSAGAAEDVVADPA